MSMLLRRMMMAAEQKYATWNPGDKYSGISLTNGNLTANPDTNVQNESLRATLGKSSGKWYWEVKGSNNVGIGRSSAGIGATAYPGVDANGWSYNKTAVKSNSGSSSGYGTVFAASDVIGVALDMTAGKVEFFKNGVSQGVAFTGLTGTIYPMCSVYYPDYYPAIANFGQSPFTYPIPAGYNPGLF